MMDAMQVRPVVLAGGSGTRLWPLSRTKLPKQLLAIAEPRSMLQATLARTAALAGAGVEALPPLLVAGEALRRLVRAQMAEAGVALAGLMLEPEPRNTAPAIVLASLWAEARGEGGVPMLVMPSDHVIGLPGAFADAVAAGWGAACAGRLVTFGIKPETPETGYGYIETGKAVAGGVFDVARFVEKPDLATAEAYVAGGRHLWNGGIFLMTPAAVLAEMAAHAPAVLAAVRGAYAGARREGDEYWPCEPSFAQAPSISIDHAVMERTAAAAVVPVAMEWSDVGSWDALWQISERDGCGNACVGEAVLIDVADSLVRVEPGGATVAALGLSDMVIVSMADAVLVAPRGRVQGVKALAEAAAARAEAARAAQEETWGRREAVHESGGHREERLWVMPGRELVVRGPAQLVALAGSGLVAGAGGEQPLRAGEAVAVAAGGQAALRNEGAGVWQILMIGFGGAA
jgi:mannose-1-phosphate guanylyltransferase/mannose-6-phosphate isomerase